MGAPENLTVSQLRPAPFNPRKISDEALASLKKSMAEFGDLSGIVKNIKTGNLVGGHQRIKNFDPSWKITKEPCKDRTGTVALGQVITPWGPWQYREVNWPLEKEKAGNVAANKHGGEFNLPKLKEILLELDTGDFDLPLTGFSEVELKDLIDWGGDTFGGRRGCCARCPQACCNKAGGPVDSGRSSASVRRLRRSKKSK